MLSRALATGVLLAGSVATGMSAAASPAAPAGAAARSVTMPSAVPIADDPGETWSDVACGSISALGATSALAAARASGSVVLKAGSGPVGWIYAGACAARESLNRADKISREEWAKPEVRAKLEGQMRDFGNTPLSDHYRAWGCVRSDAGYWDCTRGGD